MANRATSGSTVDPRQRDAERTRAELLDIATAEFARNGFSGARVDEIAAQSRTTKRMIYYYFGGKEGLYLAVLERAYSGIREHERRLNLQDMSPTQAIQRLVEFTFDYHDTHRDFVKLVGVENIHDAEHLAKSEVLGAVNTSAVDLVDDLLTAGRASGEFIADVTAIELHTMISALCYFRISNRATIRTIFGYDTADADRAPRQRQLVTDMVISFLTS